MKALRIDPAERPPLLELLAADARENGFRMLDRLIADIQSGENRFDRPGEALFAIFEGESLIAVGGLNSDPFAKQPHMGRVRRVYVHSAHRRRGFGRGLMRAIFDAASKGGFQELVLRTDSRDAAAFYEALKFERLANHGSATHRRTVV